MKEAGYPVLINIDFNDFTSYSLVFVSIKKTYQTLETVFHRLYKHLEFRQKYPAARRISTLFSVFGYPDGTLSLLFDILPSINASNTGSIQSDPRTKSQFHNNVTSFYLHYMPKNSGRFILGHFLSHFGKMSNKNFGNFAHKLWHSQRK